MICLNIVNIIGFLNILLSPLLLCDNFKCPYYTLLIKNSWVDLCIFNMIYYVFQPIWIQMYLLNFIIMVLNFRNAQFCTSNLYHKNNMLQNPSICNMLSVQIRIVYNGQIRFMVGINGHIIYILWAAVKCITITLW